MNWSWLVALVCPVMMIVMMLGMGGMHKHGSPKKTSGGDADLRGEIAQLKQQNEQITRELQRLSK
ncbi:DUF2933 domain-containing protein [Gorillibacterium massiliense]|uniref:DUF2933 domain-containing protein n=1 Tax=Gorillibacterium massiliense TaxID=1280390 RepID=UPI0004B9E39E|nr:DUF2933 domain-containing protein [Gorillibacterium massiliense]